MCYVPGSWMGVGIKLLSECMAVRLALVSVVQGVSVSKLQNQPLSEPIPRK